MVLSEQLKTDVAELSTGTSPDSQELVQRLADLEILYILSFQPMKLNGLVDSLRTAFDLSASRATVREILANLEAENLIAAFRESAEHKDSSDDVYGIAPIGLKLLKRYIESLSEITLTMQLGFSQMLVRG
jgi:DNA-binding PadR family transcriptional regulator